MATDLRQALRLLLKSPGFSALVIAVLAVGIGANTAIFSIVNGVLLRPLPFAHADRLVAVDTTMRNQPDDTSYPDFLDWHAQAKAFERLAVYDTAAATLAGSGPAISVVSGIVTSDLFEMLGVAPVRGRVFMPDDDKRGAARTVIISDALWSSRFSRDTGIVGQALRMGIVGLAIGIVGALIATRVIESLLFGVTPHDPVTFAGVSGVLLTVMLLAAHLPALRAVDPMVALRTE